ncbi:hypothetical protein KOY48_05095 [Candidatus Minimicrobia naudis]|uniref:Uncharacterized protein n=1 Tax=Candidatus Minimicrobia naudis TaxID=2841263 RepID=A0A8F1MC81_9BACT|nr:hypothetical protein KOY48_05095 [Candidatus Minimicrobia naudis]
MSRKRLDQFTDIAKSEGSGRFGLHHLPQSTIQLRRRQRQPIAKFLVVTSELASAQFMSD